MNTYESKNRAKIIATIAAIVAVVGIVILIESLQSTTKQTAANSTSTSQTSPTATADTSDTSSSTSASGGSSSTSASSTYKNGTYTADESYYVPHGSEDIKVTLTVTNGVVTNSTIVNSESDRDSQAYQEDFADEYKTYVVGKNLADIKLSYVAGASDTTDAFNDAVAAIRTQAQA